jgi:hypothetical protein
MAQVVINVPALPPGAPPGLVAWADELKQALETMLTQMAQPGGKYTLTNVTANRTFDPTTATPLVTAQTLGTLITDLQNQGALAR